MKRLIPIIVALCLILCVLLVIAFTRDSKIDKDETMGASTGATTQPTAEPTQPETTAPSSQPTEPPSQPTEPPSQPTEPPVPAVIYRNPLNGEILEEPYVGRFFAVTINNVKPALPHRGISQADLYFEMFINDYATRGLAVFSDVSAVESIGSIRSTRYNFTDLALAYDLIVAHANGSSAVLDDMNDEGVDNLNADSDIGYRDTDRKHQGYSREHTLFAHGTDLIEAAMEKNFDLNLTGQDYGLLFAEDATPVGGVAANEVEIVFTLHGYRKTTTMKYDADLGKYIYWQYGKEMVDENNDQPEAFENVIVILTKVENQGVYHVAQMYGSGEGYFACNGQMIPILWSHEGETDPFVFTLTDGTPLELGVGSTYIAVAPTNSPVNAQ